MPDQSPERSTCALADAGSPRVTKRVSTAMAGSPHPNRRCWRMRGTPVDGAMIRGASGPFVIHQIFRKSRQLGLLLALLALAVEPGSVASQAPPGAGVLMFRLIVVSTEDEASRLAQQVAQG